jgi:hypothetical protein
MRWEWKCLPLPPTLSGPLELTSITRQLLSDSLQPFTWDQANSEGHNMRVNFTPQIAPAVATICIQNFFKILFLCIGAHALRFVG